MSESPLVDFSLDPYQVEEDQLNTRYKQAIAKGLRKPTGNQVLDSFNSSFDLHRGRGEQRQIENSRKELSERFINDLANVLRNEDPEIQDLVKNPATRKIGLEQVAKRQDQKRYDKEMGKYRLQSGGALPQSDRAAQVAQAEAMSESNDPRVSTIGKARLERLLKTTNPIQSMISDGRGGYMPDPNLQDEFDRQVGGRSEGASDARSGVNEFGQPIPNVTQGQMRRGQGQGRVPPPVNPAAPSALPLSAPPVPPSPNDPVSGPISPVSGPSGGRSPPTFNLSGNVSPVEWDAINKDRVNPAPDPNPVQALPQAASRAMPAPAASRAMPAPAAMGGRNPLTDEQYKSLGHADSMAYNKWTESRRDLGALKTGLDIIKDNISRPMHSGPLGGAITAIDNSVEIIPGASASPRAENRDSFESNIQNMIAPILKVYGYNPSNVDLIAAQKSLPSANTGHAARARIVQQLERGIAFEEAAVPIISQLVSQGVPFSEAQVKAGQIVREQLANPTRAGSATKHALPASVGDKLHEAVKVEGGNFMSALKDSVANLQYATPFSEGGREGFKDAYGNIIEGAKQLVGQGNREGVAAERRAQDAKSAIPGYDQAKIFHSIANPTAAIGGAAPSTIFKLAAAGGAQGLLAPQETAGDQAVAGVFGAGIGAGLGVLGKFFPTISSSVPEMEKYLKEFAGVRPTSAQLNPHSFDSMLARILGMNTEAHLGQIQAIGKALTSKAGMPAGPITRDGVNAHLTSLGKEYDKLFPDIPQGIAAKLGTLDQKALRDSFTLLTQGRQGRGVLEAMNSQDAPNLGRILQVLQDVNVPIKVNPRDLHEAWKEVGKVAPDAQSAVAVRKTISDLIEKGLQSPESLKKFQALNLKYGTTQDMQRLIEKGAMGEGAAAETFSPSGLRANIGQGPAPGAATDRAADLSKKLKLRDYQDEILREGDTGLIDAVKAGTQKFIGKPLNALDSVIQRAPAPVKKMSEALRRYGTQVGLGANRADPLYTGEQ